MWCLSNNYINQPTRCTIFMYLFYNFFYNSPCFERPFRSSFMIYCILLLCTNHANVSNCSVLRLYPTTVTSVEEALVNCSQRVIDNHQNTSYLKKPSYVCRNVQSAIHLPVQTLQGCHRVYMLQCTVSFFLADGIFKR